MSHIKSPSSLRHVLSSILSQILCEAFSHSSLLPCLTASVASFSPLPHTLKAPGENRPSLSSGTLSTHGLNFQLLTVTFLCWGKKKKILQLLIPHSYHVTRVELASALRGPRGTTCLRTVRFPVPRPLLLGVSTGLRGLRSWVLNGCHFRSLRPSSVPFRAYASS